MTFCILYTLKNRVIQSKRTSDRKETIFERLLKNILIVNKQISHLFTQQNRKLKDSSTIIQQQ